MGNAQKRAFVKGVAIRTGLDYGLWSDDIGDIEDIADDLSKHFLQDIKDRILEKVTALMKRNISEDDIAAHNNMSVEEMKGLFSYFTSINRFERSLDANAYYWVLIDKLSEKLKILKEELYRGYIKNIGGNNTVVCVPDKAVDDLTKGWQHNGLDWQTDTLPSKIEGCTNVILYYGSSTYDTEQMSRLIDMVIQDCGAVDISTMTPRELAMLKQGWSNE